MAKILVTPAAESGVSPFTEVGKLSSKESTQDGKTHYINGRSYPAAIVTIVDEPYEEIDSCPFCGMDNAEMSTCQELEECECFEFCERREFYAVVCSVHTGGCGGSSGYSPTEEGAIKKWNRRCKK